MIESPSQVNERAQRAWEATERFLRTYGASLNPEIEHRRGAHLLEHRTSVEALDVDEHSARMSIVHPVDCECEL